MQVVNIDKVKEDLHLFQKNVLTSNDEIKIVSDIGNTVLISEKEWNRYHELLLSIKEKVNYDTAENTSNDIIKELKSKYNSFLDNLYNEIINENELNTEEKSFFINNYPSSKTNFNKFIEILNYRFLSQNPPEITIDNDGEISLEWYGRIGARLNITFSSKNEIYFISLFHGDDSKSILNMSDNNTFIRIENDLNRLFEDKI